MTKDKDSELSLEKCIAASLFGSDMFVGDSLQADTSVSDVLTDYDVGASAHLAASLRDGTPLVLEGSVVSVLADLPFAENVPSILWALDEPETVCAAHRLYGAAGIDVAVASLAGCMPEEIEQLRLNVSMKALVGAQIHAASLCGCPYVMAELDEADKPLDTNGHSAAVSSRVTAMSSRDLSAYRALILAALSCGVHGFILGHLSSLHNLRAVYETIRSVSDVPVIGFCSLVEHTLETPSGDSVEDIMMACAEIAKTDAVAVGFDEVSSHDLCQIAECIAHHARTYDVRPAVRIKSSRSADVRTLETVDAATTSVTHATEACARSGITVVGAASGVTLAMVADLVAALHT